MKSVSLQVPQVMPSVLKEPVRRLLSLLEHRAPRIMVGLAGLPGAGKSTLAAHLSEDVNRHMGAGTMMALSMDGFHLTRAQLRQLPHPEQALLRRGAPWTFDGAALEQRLHCVRQSAGRGTVGWPDFQHEAGDPVPNVHEILPAVRLVLIEGLYVLHRADGWDKVSQQFDETWYLDTPLERAMERLTLRHMRVWNMARENAQQRIAVNDRLNANLVLQSRESADWRLQDA